MLRKSCPKTKLVFLSLLIAGASGIVGLRKAYAIKHAVSEITQLIAPGATQQEKVAMMTSEFRSLRMALRTLAYSNLSAHVYDASLSDFRNSIEKFETLTLAYRQTGFVDGEELVFNNLMDSWTEFHAFGSRVIARHALDTTADREAVAQMLIFESGKYIRAFERDAAALLAMH